MTTIRKYDRYSISTKVDGRDVEIEPQHAPCEWHDVLVERVGDQLIVGYLVDDPDCQNPLEDCCGMGEIHHHPRSRYGSRDSDYYSILGCDSDGNPNIDEDKLQALWHAAVMAVPLEAFTLPEEFDRDFDGHEAVLREELAYETAYGDYTVAQHMLCAYASEYRLGLGDGVVFGREACEALAAQVEEHLVWDYDTAWALSREPGDPDAVLLDRFEHGLCRYSVTSSDGCRWDTSRGEAVWVPDQCLRDELAKIADPQERYAKAVEFAEQACDVYTDWANGNCYGYVVEQHAIVDDAPDEIEFVEEYDACWGYVGDEYVQEELKRLVEHASNNLRKSA